MRLLKSVRTILLILYILTKFQKKRIVRTIYIIVLFKYKKEIKLSTNLCMYKYVLIFTNRLTLDRVLGKGSKKNGFILYASCVHN